MIRNTFDSEAGHFCYTPCPGRGKGNPDLTLAVTEGMIYAYGLSGDEEIGKYAALGLAVAGSPPGGVKGPALAKAMAPRMRYVPALLAALTGDLKEG